MITKYLHIHGDALFDIFYMSDESLYNFFIKHNISVYLFHGIKGEKKFPIRHVNIGLSTMKCKVEFPSESIFSLYKLKFT